MSRARLLQDYLIPGSAENENTLITNYWLEFVAARDEREQVPAVKFTESDLRERVREFQKQMNAVIRNNESLRQALATERLESPALASTASGFNGIPISWPAHAGNPNSSAASFDEENPAPDDGYGTADERPSVPPRMFSTLLLKILGK